LAAVCSEDQNFLTHNGFDFKAIQAAIEYNRTHEDKRGASTISQQTAKNAFLWEGRSWLRKGLEVWFTALVELFWSKQRILEVYLNIIEFGPGIYGAEAAAQQYFGKSAAKLSRLESARLMSIVPSPRNWSIEGRIARARTRFILRQMNNWGGTLKFN
jgi:monofunctional biosynthetic peptidoglycan transglycosylase